MAALVAWGGVARADEVHCKTIDGGVHALEQIDARVRLRYLDEGLAHAAHRARIWAWTWAGIYSALTVGNGILALTTSDPDTRIDDWVGTGASFVGLAVLMILPLKVMGDQRRLERHLRRARGNEDPCAELNYVEQLLVRDAGSEAFGAGPLVHVGNFAFNIGLTLFLGIGFGHWNAAVITGMTGIAVGEIQTLSQPTDAIRMLRDYRAGRLGKGAPPPPAWMLVPTATRDHYGLSLTVSF